MSNIEWTEETWNPTTGCTEVSPGCRDCYAKFMAWRISHTGTKAAKDYEGTVKKLDNGRIVWTGKVNILEHRLLIPAQTKKPTTWFVDSMSDLFHEDIPFEFIDKVIAVMMLCPQHIFQVLTKRTERMYEYFKSRQDFDYIDEAADIIICENYHLFHVVEKLSKEGQEATGEKYMPTNQFLPHLKAQHWSHDITYTEHGKEHQITYEGDFPAKHIWLGTSIENQKTANERGPHLYELHRLGWMTWVSNEPAIGPVNWEEPFYFGFLDWLVTGGESGSKARPIHIQWARDTRDFCAKNKIPFFYKQHGSWQPGHLQNVYSEIKPLTCIKLNGELSWWSGDVGTGTTINSSENYEESDEPVEYVGKHKSGRTLDGKIHNNYPQNLKNGEI